MGYYVEVPNGHFNKAEQLVNMFGARRITPEQAEAHVEDGVKAVICVVRNPNFEAAAFCHSPKEFARFHKNSVIDDPRPRLWLVIDDRAMIEKITGYQADMEKAV